MLARVQLPVALLLIALVVVDRLADLGLGTETLLALAFGAGGLAVRRPSDVLRPAAGGGAFGSRPAGE